MKPRRGWETKVKGGEGKSSLEGKDEGEESERGETSVRE